MSKKRYQSSTIVDDEDEVFEPEDSEPEVSQCELCERTDIALNRYHLIPQSRHKKAHTKRNFSRTEMKNEVAMICDACLNQINETFSTQELSTHYYTIERLKEHTEMAKFINWVKKRPAGQTVRVK